MIGRMLLHYKVLGKLGEGGMGIVYKVLDTHLNRTLVLKVLRNDEAADPARERRFLQEARTASLLNHPNIITIHDLASAEGLSFIVMEYVPGSPLDFLIPSGGLPVFGRDSLRCADCRCSQRGSRCRSDSSRSEAGECNGDAFGSCEAA